MSKPCENCGSDLKICKTCDLYGSKTYTQKEVDNMLSSIADGADAVGYRRGYKEAQENNKKEAIPIDEIKKMKAEIDKAYEDCDIFIPDCVVHFAYVLDEIIKKYTGVET